MFPGWFAVRSGRPREVPAAPASSGLETHRPCPWALISYLLISLLVCLCHRPHFGSPQRLAYKGALLRGAGGTPSPTTHVPLVLLITPSLRLPQGSSEDLFPSPSLLQMAGLFPASFTSTWGFLLLQVAVIMLSPEYLSCQGSVSSHNCYWPRMGWVSSLVLVCKTSKW